MISLLLSSFLSLIAISDTTYDLMIGSYTREGNPGIEVYQYNSNTGAVKAEYSLKSPNASFQSVTSNRQFFYTVNEDGAGKSLVSAYQRTADGKYQFVNSESTAGSGPCYVTYREATKTVYAANYGSGSLSVFKTDNGKLLSIAQHIVYKGSGVNKARQQAPHAHQAVISPDQQFLYVTDLGTDLIHQHKINVDGTVEEKSKDIPVTPGSGARHIAFNKDGSVVYLISEMSGTVDVFSVSKDHQFKNIQRLVADTSSASSKGSGHIQLSPNGKWLLTSNRVSSDEVTVFSVQADGKLKKVGHQTVTKKPRMFSFDPSGKFVLVAGQEGNSVQIFAFNDQKGTMSDTKQDIKLPMPVCLTFIARDEPIDPEKQLKKLGISLFPPVAPIANYVKYVRVGNLLYLSGHGPDKPEGGQIYGKIGKDLTVEDGQQAARLTGISLISTLKAAVGDLNNVKRIVKVSGFVNSADGFGQQPAVMNGFSNLMVEVFGEKGKHTRTSVGVNALPNNIAVEIEMIVEVN